MVISEKEIREKFEEAVAQRGCFIVDVDITPDNDITVTIEAEDRSVDLDDCVALDEVFRNIWDQDSLDYSLTMTSAGLDLPFKDPRQFRKAVGSQVEVLFRGGKKMVAELTAADEETITLRYSAKEAVEGKKKKETVVREETFQLKDTNSVRPYITFE